MGIFNILFGKRKTTRINLLGRYIDVPDLPDGEYNKIIAYTELLEHLTRSTEIYSQVRSTLKAYESSSHTRPMSAELRHTTLLEEHVKIRAEFVEIRKQFIDLFEEMRPWLIEQQRLSQGAGLYAEQLLNLGKEVLEKAQKAQPIRLLK